MIGPVVECLREPGAHASIYGSVAQTWCANASSSDERVILAT
jgi:hypothetical protein